MYRNMILTGIIASFLFVTNAFSADWKFYGAFTTAPDTEELLFYDAGSVVNTNNSIKLWVKIVLYNDIKLLLTNKSVVDTAATKIANGYIAPLTKISPEAATAAYLEEAANDSTIKSKAEILYQLMCTENKYRRISQVSFDKAGAIDHRLGISSWDTIAPESNADHLAKILCGSK
jgi:hypothetical protein